KQGIQSQPLKPSVLFFTKCILAILYLLIQIWRIVYYFLSSKLVSQEQGLIMLISPILIIITVINILWLMNNDRIKNKYCSGLLFFFWILSVVAIIPDLIIYTNDFRKNRSFLIELIRVWLQLLIALLSFIANCFAESYKFSTTHGKKSIYPEHYINFLSVLTFGWVTKLIIQGSKRPLTEDDCWHLHFTETSANVVDRVEYYWNRSYNHLKNRVNKQQQTHENGVHEETKDLLNDVPKVELKKPKTTNKNIPKFWHALFLSFKGKLLVGGLLKFFQDILQFTGPIIL
ncbi:unnamed protein product, partial [Didymodactylos carnosus]